MASSVAESVEPKETECSVCSELFKEPKLLPCGHLLCHQCLLKWMQTQDEAHCPLCRDLIVSPKERESQNLEDLVNGFPTDLAMELILEADRILSKRRNCCVCEDVPAIYMCLNCKDMLCQSCEKVHSKLSLSKHHIVEDLSTLTTEKLVANYCSPCSTHPEEIPRLFCPSHEASICLLCVSSKHRSCPELKDLEEKIQESQTLLKQLSAHLTEGELELDRALDELDQHAHQLEKYADAAITEIEKMCDELNALVKENRQRLIEQVIDVCSAVREGMKERKNHMLKRQTKLTTHKRVIHRIGGVKNRVVVTTMSTKMKKRVEDLTCTLPEDVKVDSSFKFFRNQDAMTHIKQWLTDLGEVKIVDANTEIYKDFVFHDNHGVSITLGHNKQTAFKSVDALNGIVLSRNPLDVNVLYEVQIDKKGADRPVRVGHNSLLVGVAAVSADNMMMPTWSGHHNWPAWICPLFTSCSGSVDYSNRIGATLVSLGESHRVGLALDSERCLHLYVDGQDQGIAARHLPDPCYAMFDVVDEYEQITALPVTRLGQ